jgi:hypothetical protein
VLGPQQPTKPRQPRVLVAISPTQADRHTRAYSSMRWDAKPDNRIRRPSTSSTERFDKLPAEVVWRDAEPYRVHR